MSRFAWLGPLLMLAAVALIFILIGATRRSALLIAFIIVFSASMIYGIVRALRRRIELPPEPAPKTRGMLLEWAAPVYDFYCPWIGLGRGFRKLTLRYAGVRAGEHILDVGCGTGVLTRIAAEAVGPDGSVVGIDPGPKMIGIARKNAALENSRAVFRLAAIEDLPFEDNRFDCVLSSFMMHHLPPDLKVKGLAEVLRVLKPGGRLLVVDIDKPANPLWWLLFWPLLLWSFTRDQVSGRLRDDFLRAGFPGVERAGGRFGLLSFWKAYKGK